MCTQNYYPPGQTKHDINFPIKFTDMNLLNTYAERVGGGSGAPDQVSLKNLVLGTLATNRLTYCKQKAGDCGTPAKINLGAGAATLKYGGTAVGAAAGLGGLGALGPTFAAGAAGATALGAATLGIGLVALPILAILAHHAQAVAQEQSTLCAVTNSWNAFADAVETQLAQGKIGIQDAMAALPQIYQQLSDALRGITKGFNAGAYFQRALDALQPWNKEIVFPVYVPQSTSVFGATGSAVAGAASNTGLLLTGGGVVAAHALGVF